MENKMNDRLWYQRAAQSWMEGLPIGNGRLAAMAVQEERRDRFALNHERLWRGVTKDRTTEDVSSHLAEVRALLDAGDFLKATEVTNLYFAGDGGISGKSGRVDAYQPAGDLIFEWGEGYELEERSLCLNDGTVRGRRTNGNGVIVSEAAADCNDGALLFLAKGELPFDVTLALDRISDPAAEISRGIEGCVLWLKGSFFKGISFSVRALVDTDGETKESGGKLQILGASFVQVILDIGVEEETANLAYDFEPRLRGHQEKFREYMGRFTFCLEAEEINLPTDARIKRVKEGAADVGLQELYVHFGRYLLLSSSICGRLPANLQGKWNEELNPPWDSDYHFDINLEMNYWQAEPCGMGECVDALIALVENFYESGEKAAMDLYGCRGLYLPIQTDAWGRSTPESYGWAAWIGAAGWIGWHFWQHYRYSGDLKFLKDHGYPYFKKVALFYEDYLVEDENGMLKIYPSQSPENRFAGTGKFPVSIGISSAMDVELAYDSFTYAAESARILGETEEAEHWMALREKLPPFRIGSDGRLLEWEKEREEVEPGHRHLSHLYGLYPSFIFTKKEYEEQKEAAIRSLYGRLSAGGGHTGWSRTWVACLMARIGDKDGFYEHFNALVKDFTTSSLLDLCGDVFQIDGNLGAVAAAVEAVVSVGAQEVKLLNGLSKEWNSGSMTGVCLPGGHKLSLSWKDGKLTELEVTFGFEEEVRIEGFGVLKGRCGETRKVL